MKSSSPIAEPIIAVALLAAGRGTRFGGAKLDADLAGKPVGSWAIEQADALSWSRRFIVTSSDVPAFAAAHSGWKVLINPDAATGMGSSIAVAAKAAAGADRLLILLADMPLIPASHLEEIAQGDAIAFTEYPAGRKGAPAAFPDRCFTRLAELTGDRGAANIEWDEPIAAIPLPNPDCLRDIDTRQTLAAIRREIAPHQSGHAAAPEGPSA